MLEGSGGRGLTWVNASEVPLLGCFRVGSLWNAWLQAIQKRVCDMWQSVKYGERLERVERAWLSETLSISFDLFPHLTLRISGHLCATDEAFQRARQGVCREKHPTLRLQTVQAFSRNSNAEALQNRLGLTILTWKEAQEAQEAKELERTRVTWVTREDWKERFRAVWCNIDASKRAQVKMHA